MDLRNFLNEVVKKEGYEPTDEIIVETLTDERSIKEYNHNWGGGN